MEVFSLCLEGNCKNPSACLTVSTINEDSAAVFILVASLNNPLAVIQSIAQVSGIKHTNEHVLKRGQIKSAFKLKSIMPGLLKKNTHTIIANHNHMRLSS